MTGKKQNHILSEKNIKGEDKWVRSEAQRRKKRLLGGEFRKWKLRTNCTKMGAPTLVKDRGEYHSRREFAIVRVSRDEKTRGRGPRREWHSNNSETTKTCCREKRALGERPGP